MEHVQFPNECQASEVGDDHIIIISRGLYRSKLRSESTDGGETFKTESINLPEPTDGCEGSSL